MAAEQLWRLVLYFFQYLVLLKYTEDKGAF